MDGRTDGRMGRLIPNFLRVVQILLENAVVVSLREYRRFPKEVDYSLICVSTMHHPGHCQFCINCSFLFWYRATLFMLICILNDPVIQHWSYIFVHFPSVLLMSWSVVIVYMNWCGFFIHTRQEELLHKSITRLIMNLNDSIQSKIVEELFVV